MRTVFLLVLLSLGTFVRAQTLSPSEGPSFREQIKADRAKAAAEELVAAPARPWDRDARGRRYWDRESEPPGGEISIHAKIKAAQAKELADQREAAPSRPWDKDASGRRPWETLPH